jgi:hypothetical protein
MKYLKTFENFEPVVLDSHYQKVFDEGVKYFPKLKCLSTIIRNTTTPQIRFFNNYPKNKGSNSLEGFKKQISNYKMNKIIEWIKKKGDVKNLRPSMSTNTYYFSFNNKEVRISDHNSSKFEGTNFIIKWDTTPEEISVLIKTEFNI